MSKNKQLETTEVHPERRDEDSNGTGVPAFETVSLSEAFEGEKEKVPGDSNGTNYSSSGSQDIPKKVGPFRVKGILGEGGMGVVYLAVQDEPVYRELAVKVIRADMTDPQAVVRFDLERQAMARLSHPNIAQLHEAGTTEEGYPYFAMEHCSGDVITYHCDQLQLTIEERLTLFISICEAVQHAHQQSIIHRDLKPSNILVAEVDGHPWAKIIDFGIAKALNEPLEAALELTGDRIIGTPAFMSPEALKLAPGVDDIDTRTDVYALGVILYELLTGMRPFVDTGGSLVEFITAIATDPAPLPSQRLLAADEESLKKLAKRRGIEPLALQRNLAGDLDWIAMKAIAKVREERYGSAAELAEDVRRHLDNQPVSAIPPSMSYRFGKFVRRHKALVAVGIVAVLALLTGTVGTTIGMVRASQEAKRANTEATRASQEAERASREAKRANSEAAVANEVSKFLESIFEVSDPDQSKGDTITAREIMDRAAERIEIELAEKPLVQVRLMNKIGNVYSTLGLYEKAEQILQKTLELRRQLHGNEHADVATSLNNLAALLYHRGDFKTAEQMWREALATRRRLYGDKHARLAESLDNLAVLLFVKGDIDSAVSLTREALAMNRQLLGNEHPDVALNLNNLGAMLVGKGEYEEAERMHQEALAMRRSLYGNEHPEVAMSLNNLARTRKNKGDYNSAEPLFRETIAMQRRVLGDEHPRLAKSTSLLAEVLKDKGDYDSAEPLFREAISMQKRILGDDHPDVAASLSGLADLHVRRGRHTEAEKPAMRAVEIYRRALPKGHLSIASSESILGACLTGLRRYEKAEKLLLGSLPIVRKKKGESDASTQQVLERLVKLYEAWDKPEKATEYEKQLQAASTSKP